MKYITCKDYIRSDYYRLTGTETDSIIRLLFYTLMDVGFRFLFWFRFTRCNNVLLRICARILYRHIMLKHNICIHRETKIGYGFRITHGGPVVINASTVIGDNVDIFQYSTIGSSFFHAAKIGDNVYIGPSVCIVEDVTIGDGVTIGAGAVVIKDISEGVTVAGNPAREVSRKDPGRLVPRKWDKSWNKSKES